MVEGEGRIVSCRRVAGERRCFSLRAQGPSCHSLPQSQEIQAAFCCRQDPAILQPRVRKNRQPFCWRQDPAILYPRVRKSRQPFSGRQDPAILYPRVRKNSQQFFQRQDTKATILPFFTPESGKIGSHSIRDRKHSVILYPRVRINRQPFCW